LDLFLSSQQRIKPNARRTARKREMARVAGRAYCDFRTTAALLFVVWLCMAAPSVAQPVAGADVQTATPQHVEANWATYATDQKFALIDQLVQTGNADIAARLLPRTQASTLAERKQLRFYQGLIAKAEGRPKDAIPIFRELLAADPQFARVRLELARALFDAQEDEAAKHHFEMVLGGSAANPDLSNTVKSYLTALESRRRWEFSSYVSVAPSTNLNQGSANRVVELNGLPFELNDNNRKKSGVGVVTGAQGGYRQPVTDTIDILATAGVHVKRYGQKDFNDTLASASLGPRVRFDQGQIGIYGTVDKKWMADADLSTGFGGLVAGSYRLGVQDSVHADVGCTKRRYSNDWQQSDLTYQDGRTCSLSGRYEHALDITSFVRVLGAYGREKTNTLHLDNTLWNAGAGIHKDLPMGLSVYLQGLYTRRNYEGVFPTTTSARQDQRLDLSVNVTKRDFEIFGLAPMVQYTYTKNDSNVGFYQYDAHGFSLTLTKRF
jgi:outer membrane protein